MRPEQLISPRTRFLDLPEGLELECGRRLAPVRLAYRTWGRLPPGGDNAVLVCHALTGSADVEAWWGDLLGSDRCLDPGDDFVVCCNVLGSCYGSTGPSSVDPTTGRANVPAEGEPDDDAQSNPVVPIPAAPATSNNSRCSPSRSRFSTSR